MAAMNEGLTHLANGLLQQLHIPVEIECIDDMTSMVFVLIYEGLCGEKLPDIVREPSGIHDEITNSQLVIDALSMDILHMSLSHITGEAVARKSSIAIGNLLEIFSGLMEYILNKIDSDVSSTDDCVEDGEEDPDQVSAHLIDDILDRELASRCPSYQRDDITSHSQPIPAWSPQQGIRLESTASLIREGELLDNGRSGTSPPVRDRVISSLQSANNILLSELETPELSPPAKSATSKFDGVGNGLKTAIPSQTDKGNVHRTYTHHLYHYYGAESKDKPLSSRQTNLQSDLLSENKMSIHAQEPVSHSQPQPSLLSDNQIHLLANSHRDPQTQRVPLREMNPPSTTTHDSRTVPGPSTQDNVSAAYRKLENEVEKTVQLSRDAVSPPKHLAMEDLLSSNIRTRLSRLQTESSEIHQLARSLNALNTASRDKDKPLSQSLGVPKPSFHQSPEKKVSFQVKANAAPENPSGIRLQRNREKTSKGNVTGQIKGSQVKGRPIKTTTSRLRTYSSDGEQEEAVTLREALSNKQTLRKFLAEIASTNKCTVGGKKTKVNSYGIKRVQKPDHLSEISRQVKSENRKACRKTEYIRLLYENELEDLKDEVDSKKKKAPSKTEIDYKKKVLGNGKPKLAIHKTTGKKPIRGRSHFAPTKKARRRSSSASPSVGRFPDTTIEEENNLFTLLYEEFPYLYLSADTWHELWRQGIQQIERLTRSHQTLHTRRNRGAAQLEEAENRQKLMLDIMRKELAHTQRMREQKLKREQELSVKNQLHEKRQQSARSRKYYTDYQVRSRAKMLKRRTKEEMVFKKLFREGLDIQKERIKELRRYAKDQREIQHKERQNDVDSLENYYRDQFEMLAESVAKERQEQEIRDKAQSKVLDQMKKELRKKMEREIEEFQDQLFRDDDDIYFRELDANRIQRELRMAKYNVKV